MLLDIKDLKPNFPRACTEEGKRFHFEWKADVISGDISHIYLYHQLLETYIFSLSTAFPWSGLGCRPAVQIKFKKSATSLAIVHST